MGWKKDQKRAAGSASRTAKWEREHIDMVLRGFGNRAMHEGQLTRKSPRLNQDDFEIYMSIAESHCHGKLPGFTLGYWRRQSEFTIRRQLRKIRTMAEQLADEGHLAEPQLNGVIGRATSHAAESLQELKQHNDRQLAGKVIDALKSIGTRHRVIWKEPPAT